MCPIEYVVRIPYNANDVMAPAHAWQLRNLHSTSRVLYTLRDAAALAVSMRKSISYW